VLACAASLAVSLSALAADLKSPDQVKNALRILAYVQDDMSRKLPTKSYSRLPHENEEFQEAAVPMRESVAEEPAAFKAQVESALTNALAVAEVSKTNDDEKIKASVTAVADALTKLNALFPEALRPVAGQLGSGPPRTGGPPPGLR
jgi:cytochrome c556